jgi:hypothetical protein
VPVVIGPLLERLIFLPLDSMAPIVKLAPEIVKLIFSWAGFGKRISCATNAPFPSLSASAVKVIEPLVPLT